MKSLLREVEEKMDNPKATSSSAREHGLPAYFDMQARIGHTKHVGGWKSTQEIVEMMSLKPGMDLLYVGSGSGIAAIQIAERYDCHVMGVDLLEEMVEVAQEWAERKGASDRVEFRVADAMMLPFEENRFDVLLCESVNTFISDLDRAAAEYVRVVKPGGYVGLNEAIWYTEPPEEGAALMRDLTGQELRHPQEWIAMLKRAGLEEIRDRTYQVDMRDEFRSQMGFLSWRDFLSVIGRSIKTLFADSETRELMRLATNEPRSAYDYMGYGLFVGRVPAEG
ncbi:MAG: methyltransferase domain-containing protein [Anaerolineales bacterium]